MTNQTTPTEENGWQIIVPADHSKFLPKISTDEHWHNGDWSDCINNELFSDNVIYRRRIATPSAIQYATNEKGWTQDTPAQPGSYWHWNGDEDCSPIHMEVMTSGHPPNCTWFAPAGQWGWDEAKNLNDLGGWWMKLETPKIPTDGITIPPPNTKAREMIENWSVGIDKRRPEELIKALFEVLDGK